MKKIAIDKKLMFSFGLRYIAQSSQSFYYVLMPFLVTGLNAQPHAVKLTVSVFFLGFAISLFLGGPLIDQIGERKTAFLGLSIFMIGTGVCYFSVDIQQMMTGRFIQGLALGMLRIMSKTILASGEGREKSFALYHILTGFASPFTMVITSLLLFFFSWHACFVFLVLLSMLVLWGSVNETTSEKSAGNLSQGLREHLDNYITLIKDKRFVPFILAYAFISIVLTPYYLTVSYTLTQVLHYKVHYIALISGAFALASFIGTYMSIRTKDRFETWSIAIGYGFCLVACFLFYACSLLFLPSLFFLIAPLLLYSFGSSYGYARFNLLIVSDFEYISRNTALSASAFTIAVLSTLVTLLASYHKHQNFIETSRLMLGIALVSFISYQVYLWMSKRFTEVSK